MGPVSLMTGSQGYRSWLEAHTRTWEWGSHYPSKRLCGIPSVDRMGGARGSRREALTISVLLTISERFLTPCCYCLAAHLCLTFVTPWTATQKAFLSFTISRRFPKLISTDSVIPFNHLILSTPSPPAFNLSQLQGLF